MSSLDQEGGFMKSERRGGGFERRRKASQSGQPKVYKTYADRQTEEEAARKRWSGIPLLVVAREMIAEANLSEDAIAELSATVVKLNETGELEPMIRSGKLAEMLAEFAAGAIA